MKLSQNFSLAEATFSETAIRLGVANAPNELQLKKMIFAAEKLEQVRALLEKPIKVNSWFRSEIVNRSIGGAKNSAHLAGFAIDFTCPEFGSVFDICKKIEQSTIKYDQLIFEYASWTHISFDSKQRQQNLTILNPQKIYVMGIWGKDDYTKKAII
ncbi:MAG: peptidase M15 [Oligoflexia bacterium]|nr:peptidase M15 [Oligoflexia bacterium]